MCTARIAQSRELTEQIEHINAALGASVEHPFRMIKLQFGYPKVRYRGLANNGAQTTTLSALANLWMARQRLLVMTG